MSDAEWRMDDDPDKDEEDDNYYEYSGLGRDSIIFLIDCTEPMFIKMETEEKCMPFELAIKCAINVMKNKIISSERDLIGVVLFGSEQTTGTNFKHLYTLQNLEQPGAKSILELEALLKNGKEHFTKTYGHSLNFSLSDALWSCSSMFSTCPVKLSNRRVLLFTNQDDPHHNSRPLQQQAIQRARDLYENGIEVDLMHIAKAGMKFDVELFYKDIVMLPDDEVSGTDANASDKFEELLTRVRTKDHKKRTAGRIDLTLPGDISIAVGLYNLVRPLYKPYPVHLSKDTNEELRSMSKTYLEETGEILLPNDIGFYQEYGGKKMYFDKDAKGEISQIFKPGIVLLGFKPASLLRSHYHVKPASFIYPDEKRILGSSTLFAALLQKCLDRKVVAICRYVPRANSHPDIVALMPQKEELDANNVQVVPPGFHVIPLPYAEDVRILQLEKGIKAEEEQIEKAKEIVKKLHCVFRSENFENPVLQTHWRNIEALALEEDELEDMIDYTLPVVDAMERRAGKLIEEFKAMVFPDGFDPSVAVSKKRPPAKTQNAETKRIKKEELDLDIATIAAEAKSGKLSKLTVDVLKKYCKFLGGTTTGKKKADLIADIESKCF